MWPHLIILFVLVPMLAGILCLVLHNRPLWQRGVGLLACGFTVAFAAAVLRVVYQGPQQPGRVLVSQLGNWPAPFGISVVVDPLSALMLITSAVVCLAVLIYSIGQLPRNLERAYYHPLFHFLIMGINWSFITGDLFNLFVAFEIMLMAGYALFILGTSLRQMRQAYKYVLLNLFASLLLVSGCGLIYGQFGTLNLADLARLCLTGQVPATSIPVIGLLLVVFGTKTAIFPLWFWLPETYPTLPTSLVALFAGLKTKVGAYVLIRLFVLVFGPAVWLDAEGAVVAQPVSESLWPLLAISAAVTMFIGVLGAVSMHTVKSILSIHIISQVGYMAMGVGLGVALALSHETRVLAVAGAAFFIIHNMVVKCGLFLCGGLMSSHAGSDDLDRIGGIVTRAPWLATLFLIAALSLAGLPPLSGFFGKFVLLRAGFQAGAVHEAWYWVTGFAIATSLLTLLSMLKIWSYGFWSPAPSDAPFVRDPEHRPRIGLGLTAVGILVAAALVMGLGAQPCLEVATVAAEQLVDPRLYIHAVLGEPAMEEIAAVRPDLPPMAEPDPMAAAGLPWAGASVAEDATAAVPSVSGGSR